MSFEKSDNLPKYFKTIAQSTPLTLEEERALAVRIKEGDQVALHKLVTSNLKIVVTIANRHVGQGVPIDDLIQEGNLGLYEAAQRFDPKGNARFISYASLWIRKRLNETVVATGRIVRLPHNQEYDIYKAKMAGEETQNLSSVAIDAKVSDDNDTTIGDKLLKTKSDIEFEIEFDYTQFTVRRVMGVLNPREQKIVAAYFGIGLDEELATSEIAAQFEMTSVRVSQIIKTAIQKMKQII